MLVRKIKTFCTHPVASVKSVIRYYRVDRQYDICSQKLSAEVFPSLSDEEAIRYKFFRNFGRYPNLRHPKTFNEKLQWLKLHDRKPEYTIMADKYGAKKWIADRIGEEYVVPTLGVWDRAEDVDFDNLPDQFVLKCTHDSGSIVLCKDKSTLDIPKVREQLNACLKRSPYETNKEWVYKDIKPRIIAEPYLVDESGWELKDYKIFCFNGHAEYIEVDFNRFVKHKLNPYDFNWNPLHFCDSSKNDYEANIPKPVRLEDMRRIAETLSKGIPFLRVDFYSIYDRLYVGELTFYPGNGCIAFDPPEMDLVYGNKLVLPIKEESNHETISQSSNR